MPVILENHHLLNRYFQIIHDSLLFMRNYSEANLNKQHVFLGLLTMKSLMKLKLLRNQMQTQTY